jgi:hypothetical protein
MNYCNDCITKKKYIYFKNNQSFCSLECLNLGPKNDLDSESSEESEIDPNREIPLDLVFSKKYIFDLVWTNSLYFKVEVFLYKFPDELMLYKCNLLRNNLNTQLFDNLQFESNEPTITPVLLQTQESSENLDQVFMRNLFNNSFVGNGFFWQLVKINQNLGYFFKQICDEFHKSGVFKIQNGIEILNMGNHFKMNETAIYFNKYILYILTKAFSEIFKTKIIPNPFSDDPCNKNFQIIIPDLKNDKEKWILLMADYLKRDDSQIEMRAHRDTMMETPPHHYINKNNYFHFIAIDDQNVVMGYIVCKLFPLGIRGTFNFLENLKKIIPDNNNDDSLHITDTNYQYFINYLSDYIGNKDASKIWYYDDENLKTNVFSIESLTVDISVRGAKFRLAHFLVYHAMLFIQNSYKDLHVGLVSTFAAAGGTGHIVEKYFGLTRPPRKNKENKEFFNILEQKTMIADIISQIYHEISNISDDELIDFNKGLNNPETPLNDITYHDFFKKGKHLQKLRTQQEDNDLSLKIMAYNINATQSLNKSYGGLGFTHILWIENESFIEHMKEYSKKLKNCIPKKRKIIEIEDDDDEREKKKKRLQTFLKNGLTLDHMNSIFK